MPELATMADGADQMALQEQVADIGTS